MLFILKKHSQGNEIQKSWKPAQNEGWGGAHGKYKENKQIKHLKNCSVIPVNFNLIQQKFILYLLYANQTDIMIKGT